MSEERLVQRWHAWRHLQNLIRFRSSGQLYEAWEDWLDKEIEDLHNELELINHPA